jgi:hypothetical protein
MRKGNKATDKLTAAVAEGISRIPVATVRRLAKIAAEFTLVYRAALEPKPPEPPAPKPRRKDPIDVVYPEGLAVDEAIQRSWHDFDDLVYAARTEPAGLSQEREDAVKELPAVAADVIRRYKNRESILEIAATTTYRGAYLSPEWITEVLERKNLL